MHTNKLVDYSKYQISNNKKKKSHVDKKLDILLDDNNVTEIEDDDEISSIDYLSDTIQKNTNNNYNNWISALKGCVHLNSEIIDQLILNEFHNKAPDNLLPSTIIVKMKALVYRFKSDQRKKAGKFYTYTTIKQSADYKYILDWIVNNEPHKTSSIVNDLTDMLDTCIFDLQFLQYIFNTSKNNDIKNSIKNIINTGHNIEIKESVDPRKYLIEKNCYNSSDYYLDKGTIIENKISLNFHKDGGQVSVNWVHVKGDKFKDGEFASSGAVGLKKELLEGNKNESELYKANKNLLTSRGLYSHLNKANENDMDKANENDMDKVMNNFMSLENHIKQSQNNSLKSLQQKDPAYKTLQEIIKQSYDDKGKKIFIKGKEKNKKVYKRAIIKGKEET